MSAQPLSTKSLRRLERLTGLTLARAVAHGGSHDLHIVTADHKHGTWDRTTGAVRWESPVTMHLASCRDLFPEPTP